MSSNHAKTDNYPTLSRPFESMKPEYDVLVIGSGYGAGVAASRMARAGKSVAVLELGWERRCTKPPSLIKILKFNDPGANKSFIAGSFPHTFSQCLRDMNVSGSSANNGFISNWLSPRDPTRLFQLTLGDGQHVFSAHDYARAETMLQPSVYPEDFPTPSKLEHLKEQSKSMGHTKNFRRAPLTTFFHRGRNNAAVQMEANSRTGHECTGLNDGSKNSVATTYLADAWNWGAEIFCGCEVRFVEKADEGQYIVHFAWHGSGRSVFSDHFREKLFWVKSREFCFLGAGSLGTTEILLRSKSRGLRMSPLVGRNLSGNGDMLIFGYNEKTNINGIARQSSDPMLLPGPTITSVIDNRNIDSARGRLSGYVLQDGCIPEAFNPVIHSMLILQTMKNQALSLFVDTRNEKGKFVALLKSLLLGPYALGGALQRTSTYLVMSHDSNEMMSTLKNDQLCLSAPKEGRSEHFKRIKGIFHDLFTLTGAKMGVSYFYGRHQEEVTVHLLGGANMSCDGTGQGGATNQIGEVFTGHGSEVHDGLVCCDASIIPTALGVNPLATISALSERSLDFIAKKAGLLIDLETKNDPLDIYSKPKWPKDSPRQQYSSKDLTTSIGWQFTEALFGHIHVGPGVKDYGLSEGMGKSSSCSIQMLLTVDLRKHPESGYQGACVGTVSCHALSKSTLRAQGKLEFFTTVKESAEALAILYHLQLVSVDGTRYHLEGRKLIDSAMAFSVKKTWKATTTVNLSITRPDGTNVGFGAVHISLSDFKRQVQTFRTTQTFRVGLLLTLITFLLSFLYHISIYFFRPFGPAQYPTAPAQFNIDTKKPSPASYEIKASDGVHVRLDVYESSSTSEWVKSQTTLPPILLLPGVTGLDAKHNLFALPFLRCNVVQYFTERGHRCYALTPRWGCDSKDASRGTVFDCRLDVAAALKTIRDREPRKPYVIAHCQGSVALCMGILDGTIESSQILGITANSVFMNQVFGYWNSLKGRTTLLIRLYEFMAGDYFPILSSSVSPLFQRLLDCILCLYPVGHTRDICTSTACRRTSFVFGLLWNHQNLDLGLHENVHQFFAGTHTRLMKQVVNMGTKGICVNNDGHSLLTKESLERLQGLPILFISGTDNQVFDPETTLKDYELLRRHFGEKYYRRFLAEGYGHLDPIVGKRAATDVYWRIFAHLRGCIGDEQPESNGVITA
ncbi:unnamed protein product [Penicillium salamii]|uniref:Cholesterol oxidase n=1 Tax=Penicillium salamii TaxID=1612424 RepID=A0A9W4J389_9EURO|nr:unnamed protein product [Penicillium salamii]CAG8084185.1 unnamed protein product [Penicillium salamii]CAG8135846.1 unnamed protein product [Penicillium salamii]CAG8181355.1 unnamed protein product [Penicillium salamii]CAG8273073.1 unnamed protein product [Penicillium salamii]